MTTPLALVGALLLGACATGEGRDLPTTRVTAPPVSDTVPATSISVVDPASSPSSTAPPASSGAPATTPIATTANEVVPEGFASTQATITTADGEVCELCVWLANTPAQRSDGLMRVTDLGEADAMAFVYDTPTTTRFWMKDTVVPLSIAFFDERGAFLDAFDMEPCADDPCDRYPTPSDFLVAVEFEQGELAEFGVAGGSVLELTDLPCEPA